MTIDQSRSSVSRGTMGSMSGGHAIAFVVAMAMARPLAASVIAVRKQPLHCHEGRDLTDQSRGGCEGLGVLRVGVTPSSGTTIQVGWRCRAESPGQASFPPPGRVPGQRVLKVTTQRSSAPFPRSGRLGAAPAWDSAPSSQVAVIASTPGS